MLSVVSRLVYALQNGNQARHRRGDKKPLGDETARFLIAPGVSMAVHETGLAILHVRTGNVHLCSGMAAGMLANIAAGNSTAEVVRNIARDHGISEECAHNNVNWFINALMRRRLVIRQAPRSKCVSSAWLRVRALWELIAYDIKVGLFGFRAVHGALERQQRGASRESPIQEDLIRRLVRAVSVASTFYWHPVRCLQRSIVLARLLRDIGVPAQLVIGYRMTPFFSHAWVEVNGRVINDSPALPQRLMVLHRV